MVTPFECVIVDATGKGKDNLPFCEWLRAQISLREVYLLVICRADLAAEAIDAGASDLLAAPLELTLLDARIALAERRIQAGTEAQKPRENQLRLISCRAQQQAAVAALSQAALIDVEFATLAQHALVFIAQTLEVEFCGFLKFDPASKTIGLRSGYGWKEGTVGQAVVECGPTSPQGEALYGEPVIVRDWSCEPRFLQPPFLREHGVASSITVGVPGKGKPFGILEAHSSHVRDFSENDLHFLQAISNVLSMSMSRRENEAEIQKLAAFPRHHPNPILEFDAEGELKYFNEAAGKMAQSFSKASIVELLPEDYARIIHDCLFGQHPKAERQNTVGRRTLSWLFFPVIETRTVHCYAEEATERLGLEAQIRQLQKMESVGRLAAGLAHDFNNVLTIIRGHADIMLVDPNLPEKRAQSLNRILGAVDRASNLTRQMLTFSRKQVIDTKTVNLNEVIRNVLAMLDRVLGEDIKVEFNPSPNLPSIQADSGMLDQVVMNLAVNARDAIEVQRHALSQQGLPYSGQLILTTSAVEVDEAFVQHHSQARTGRFVCLSVTDTGCGMDARTVSRIFEPFFTTKGIGRGTGLGLATVYGILKQHEGWIEVVSQPGQGTTFLIFIPSGGTLGQIEPDEPAQAPVQRGSETILLVEDEPTLRELARLILQSYGYQIIEAASGVEALKIWKTRMDEIQLLITDLVMPAGLTGIELADRLHKEKPELKIIYTSGYSSDVAGKDLALSKTFRFLAKPYPAESLGRAVREAFDSP